MSGHALEPMTATRTAPGPACLRDEDGPYFVIDRDQLRRRYWDFRLAFADAAIFYAVKANPHAAVLATLASEGCGFEIASAHELEMLAPLGVEPERIIFGTAVKAADQIRAAHEYGVRVFAADSDGELERIAANAPGAGVYIRVIVDDSASVFRMSRKFGVAPERAVELLGRAREFGLEPLGLSFNVGSQSSDPDAWARAITSLTQTISELCAAGMPPKILNIGGGFPGPYKSAAPGLEEIAASVYGACEALPVRPRLVLEPGRAIVAEAAALVTNVIARAEREDGSWLYLDAGAYNALFEALSCQGSTRYPVDALGGKEGPPASFVLAGPTGDGLDVVDECAELPASLAVGDQLVFRNVGAYSMGMSSTFNGFPLPDVRVV